MDYTVHRTILQWTTLYLGLFCNGLHCTQYDPDERCVAEYPEEADDSVEVDEGDLQQGAEQLVLGPAQVQQVQQAPVQLTLPHGAVQQVPVESALYQGAVHTKQMQCTFRFREGVKNLLRSGRYRYTSRQYNSLCTVLKVYKQQQNQTHKPVQIFYYRGL